MKDDTEKDYDIQIKNYIENHLNLKDYKIIYKEEGAIPLFYPINETFKNKINIGTAGCMTRTADDGRCPKCSRKRFAALLNF